MGFGGETTVLGVKMTGMHRLPASYFVSVSYMCWAYRRRRMIVGGDACGLPVGGGRDAQTHTSHSAMRPSASSRSAIRYRCPA